MSPVLVTVGTSIRSWITFEVKDATLEEINVLTHLDSPEALALMKALDDDERLIWRSTDHDDAHDCWSDDTDPSVVDVLTEDGDET